jgi:pectin methylesterase-like acyl-CoA thioesterase
MNLKPGVAILATLTLATAAYGQTVVFSDSFTNGSTLNPTAATYVAPTAKSTQYEIASTKSATSSAISSAAGTLTLGPLSTSSGYAEAQALFTTTPITLSAAGQYIEVYYTITDNANTFNGYAANNAELNVGLYYSGGSPPTNGTALWSSGLSSGLTTAVNGGAKGWVGYSAMIAYSSTSAQTSDFATRPAQTGANNLNQALGVNSGYANPAGTQIKTLSGVVGQPTLTTGNQYTLDLNIAYVNSTTLAITTTLYNGAGNSGSIVSSGSYTAQYGANTTSAEDLTSTFDALEVGFRPTSPSSSDPESVVIDNVTVLSYIPAAPTITGLTNQTVIAGTTATLNPTITGVPTPAYQWQTNGVNIGNANSASLVLTNVQYSQNNYVYSLIASNFVGAVTNSMTLSVIVTPAITGLGPQAASLGSTVSISPTVTGVPAPTLQWQTNGVDVTDGLDINGSTISGSTNSTLTITDAQVADSGTYSLIASNSAGSVTNSMTLTVSPGNVLPVLNGPANLTVIQGNNATFSASASGNPIPTLQWLDQTGTPIPDATNDTFTVTDVQYSENGYTYSLVASNVVGSVTNTATLTVIVTPSITTQPVSLVVTNTQSASFTVAASGVPNPIFQWYSNNVSISSALNNSATNATLTLASVGPSASGSSYYAQISNSAGSTNSASATLTVNSTMTVVSLSPSNNAPGVCYDTPLYLTFSSTPVLTKTGTIKIYNVTNTATPVDTINLGLSVNNPSPGNSYVNIASNVQPRTIANEIFTNFPVIITGTTAAIYPHLDLLTSNQTYYVTVDDGTFTDAAGANFAGILTSGIWQFTTKPGGPANPTNLVVAQDYSGDFATVQGAVDSVPANNTTPTVINIQNGVYTEIVDIHSKNNLLLRGQSRLGTMVGYPNNANLQGSTHYRMAFKVNGNDIALDNLTVTNMTPVGGSQAEALMLESNVKRFVFNNCNLGSYQDTLLANGSTGAQAYFNNDLIEGQYDYIWGGGDLFFTNCEIRTLLGYNGSVSGGNVTAARTDNQAAGNWAGYNGLYASNGFSFVNCLFTRSVNTITSTTLADSNGSTNGNVAWINCNFDSNYIVPSAAVLNSQLLWEYGNSNLTDTAAITFGLAVGDSAPALTSGDPRLLAAENSTTWLNGWVPQLAPNIVNQPASQSVSGGATATFTVVATGIAAPVYQWLFNGNPLAGQTGASLVISSANANNAGSYSVIVSNAAGVVVSAGATLTVGNTAPSFTPVADQTVNVGAYLSVSNVATDPDVPAQTLTYSLLTGPAGSAVDNNGTFTWRPTVGFAGTTNAVQVVVTDNGTPNLSATNSFSVIVNPLTPPTVNASSYSGGWFSVTVSGLAGPDYALEATTNLLGGTWVVVAVANSPASPFTLTDTNAAAQPVQFYRVVTGPPLP